MAHSIAGAFKPNRNDLLCIIKGIIQRKRRLSVKDVFLPGLVYVTDHLDSLLDVPVISTSG